MNFHWARYNLNRPSYSLNRLKLNQKIIIWITPWKIWIPNRMCTIKIKDSIRPTMVPSDFKVFQAQNSKEISKFSGPIRLSAYLIRLEIIKNILKIWKDTARRVG
jgi:hypothetical protein